MENIKASAFDEYINDNFSKMEVVEIGGVQVEVKHHLSFEEMVDFVDYVSRNCFQGNDRDYYPQLKDFLFRIQIIIKYTNIQLPDDLNEKYDFLYRSDMISKIVECINPNEIRNLLEAINSKINSIQDIILDDYRRKIDEIYSSILDINKRANEVYNELSSEDMTNIIQAFAGMENNTINEEVLAKSVLNYKNLARNDEDAI